MDKRIQITIDILALALKVAPEIAESIRNVANALKEKNGITDDQWNNQRAVREMLEAEILE